MHLDDRREPRGRRDVLAHGPRTRCLYVVRIKHERAQKLRALPVRRVLENTDRLRPRDEVAGRRGEGEVERRSGCETDGGGEGRDERPIGVGYQRRGGIRASHEARVLLKESVEPLDTLRLEGQVERIQHGVVVIGEGEDELVLELGFQEVRELDRAGAVHEVGVPYGCPVENQEAVVEPVLVSEGLKDLVEAERLVGKQHALGLPAREVVECLQCDAVDEYVAGRELSVNLNCVSGHDG